MRPPLSLRQKLALWAGTTAAGVLIGLGWFLYQGLLLREESRDALAFWVLILVPLQAAMFWSIGGFVAGFLLFLLAFLLPSAPDTSGP